MNKWVLSALLISLLTGCAADPTIYSLLQQTNNTAITTYKQQLELEKIMAGAGVTFHQSSFFSLVSPRADTSCAGDAKIYYEPLLSNTATGATTVSAAPSPLPTSLSDNTMSLQPSFISNISVDLTDSNSPLQANLGYACSLGIANNVPPPSSCASFDFPSVGGLSTNMGGSLILVGGIAGAHKKGASTPDGKTLTTTCGRVEYDTSVTPNVAYDDACYSDSTITNYNPVYALTIDAFPATTATHPPDPLVPGLTSATEAISTWVNLANDNHYSGPSGMAGAAGALSYDAKKALFFGGSNVTTGVGNNSSSLILGRTTADTWVLNLIDRTWSLQDGTAIGTVEPTMKKMIDYNPGASPSPTTTSLDKPAGARALFGYMATTGFSVNTLSSGAGLGKASFANMDLTERIVIAGGLSAGGPQTDVHIFNPTFGPELMDAGNEQWVESYHTRLLTNTLKDTSFTLDSNSNVKSQFPPYINHSSVATLVPIPETSTRDQPYMAIRGSLGAGYILGMGGFDASKPMNIPDNRAGQACVPGSTTDLTACGPLMWSATTRGDTKTSSSFISIPNAPDTDQVAPLLFSQVADTANRIPWYGGGHLIAGVSSLHDVTYFGGTNCRDYLTDTLSTCKFNYSPKLYTSLDAIPANTGALAAPTALTGATAVTDIPAAAGMAAARGLDETGNPIIVAWGGVDANGAPSGTINVVSSGALYYQCGSTTPTQWYKKINVGVGPPSYVQSAMVYSHVTGKFYLFGGYDRNSTSNPFVTGNTWELTVTMGGNCATPASVSAVWRPLTAQDGLTCYPSCPQARHSHRMVEVDYYDRNINAGAYVDDAKKFLITNDYCKQDTPCSFGIFMEGGTDGSNYFSDRWMFDPTANPTTDGPMGQWIRMAEVPPRTLAAMTSFEYTPIGTTSKVRRSLLYGGETGMQSPTQAKEMPVGTARFYVAPTLGDTLMYDFDKQTWNRAQLYGHAGTPSTSELELRQKFTPGADELTPPPLSGAVMVTRTHKKDPALGTLSALTIPEVFLFGGRKVSGEYYPLTNVHKFCPGTTGETWNGAATIPGDECDHFDSVLNPSSPSPSSKYVGRWTKKSPADPTTTATGPFMGAATYDSSRDLIIAIGGRFGGAAGDVVTQLSPAGRTEVFEYLPPAPITATNPTANPEGVWTARAAGACNTPPMARYGHTLSFDNASQKLIMVGGYSVGNGGSGVTDGTPFTQTVTYSSGTYTLPEVWTAIRDDINNCYNWKLVSTFGNYPNSTQSGPQYGFGFATGLFVPSQGYKTGFYTMMDSECTNQGPISSTDGSLSKLLAGGVSFDIDRSALGPNENVLLHITYLPLGESTRAPDGGYLTAEQSAFFKVHLMRTGQVQSTLRSIIQPRYLSYSSTDQFPYIVDTFSILAPPADGTIRQEQMLIPLSMDAEIDRIRVERYLGSAIILDASLFRMGYR